MTLKMAVFLASSADAEDSGLLSNITHRLGIAGLRFFVSNGGKPFGAARGAAFLLKRSFTLKNNGFKAGDKVVYPGHGVGEISSVQSRSIAGSSQQIYEITLVNSGMKIMVPLVQAHTVGLRKVVDKRTVAKVYEILKKRDFKMDTQTWNRRFREYNQKIKTGSVYEIAEVLRDLSVLSADKELSFGEKKMLDTAQSLLVSEIAVAKARPQEKVIGELKAIFE